MKKLNKTSKIVIAVAAAVLVVAGVALGLYFGLKEKPHETSFAETAEVQVIDSKNIIFSYTCPYMDKNTAFRIDDKNGLVITYKDKDETKTLPCTISSSKYEASEAELIKYGKLSLSVTLKEEIKENVLYKALLKKDSISLKKENYTNGEITADFTVTKTEEGLFEVEKEVFVDSKLVTPSNVEAKLSKENGKAYLTVTAQIDGITKYDENALQNFTSFIAIRYKNENGTFGRFLNRDVEFSAENGKVIIKGTLDKEDLIPGQDYKLIIKKGFFSNDDKSVVNDDYEGDFTYVE
ncbi:MAG: hypothetical protein IJ279_05335 [Clostridia bacterium]|nr:hypothetical protein [Clostridia bacterium]